jgi:tetratricopeptide (TPR) repeat protein
MAINSSSLAPHQIIQPLAERPPSFICPITNDIMKEPVMDKHGHSFEKTAILQWLKTKSACPMNQQPITPDELAPNRALQDIIEMYQTQGFPTPQDVSHSPGINQGQNDAIAKPLLMSAQDLEQNNQFADAEKLYLMALQFTSKSEDYAHLPRLFEKKGEKERSASAYVVLADLQLTEGKPAEATLTLKKSLKLNPHPAIKEKLGNILNNHGQKQEAALLFLELTQQALYNNDALQAARLCRQSLDAFPGHAEAWKTLASMQHEPSEIINILLKGANEPVMPIKERLALCRRVSIKDPEHIPAKLLFLELNQLKMKDKIKQLKLEIRGQLPLVSSVAFGKAKWEQYFGDIGVEPPLPKDIEQILSASCPFWPSKKVHETHFLVLIPQTVNGQPLTLKTLVELVKKPLTGNAIKCESFYPREYTDPAGPFSHWVLMTHDVIEGSCGKSYPDQQALLSQKGHGVYVVPPILDAAICISMKYVQSGTRLDSNKPYTLLTRCQEKYLDTYGKEQMTVEGFASDGLSGLKFNRYNKGGVAGFRKI